MGRKMGKTGALGLVIVLSLVHLAAASPAEGTLLSTGKVSFNPTASTRMAPLGAIILDTTKVTSIQMQFPSATLCHYKVHYVDVNVLGSWVNTFDPASSVQSCYPLTNVLVAMADGDQAGWFGVVALPGSAMQVASS